MAPSPKRMAAGAPWGQARCLSAIATQRLANSPAARSRRCSKHLRQRAERAFAAGFRVIEIHAAHGYLLHEFLSPLSNNRTDACGGSFENRTRFLRETVAAVRKILPERCPVFVRISATDWVNGGWDVDQSVEACAQLKTLGVDLIELLVRRQCGASGDPRRLGLSDAHSPSASDVRQRSPQRQSA